MKRTFDMMALRFVLAILLIVSGLATAGQPRVLDPSSLGPNRDLLMALAGGLDAQGVDVILGKPSDFPSDPRPRLAHLSGFKAKSLDWSAKAVGDVSVAFSHGFIGGIFAYKADVATPGASTLDDCHKLYAGKEQSVCEYVERWLATPKQNRIFVAFTREDFDIASIVAGDLQRMGYVTFMFLKGKDDPPWADERIAGALFASSGIRFVIDTANSRGSSGVAFETACCEYHLWSPSPYQRWINRLQTG